MVFRFIANSAIESRVLRRSYQFTVPRHFSFPRVLAQGLNSGSIPNPFPKVSESLNGSHPNPHPKESESTKGSQSSKHQVENGLSHNSKLPSSAKILVS